jgi:hypothetical protein
VTRPDVVFARFVQANPAPHPEVLHRERPDVDEMLAQLHGTMPMARPVLTSPWSQTSRWLAAAAVFLAVLGLAAALSWMTNPAQPPIADPVETLREDAATKAEQWLEAVNTGAIDDVMSMSTPDSATIADRRVHEWVAGLAAHGMPVQVIGCEALEATSQGAIVECQVHLTDAVAVELGVTELIAPFRYSNGLLAWQPYTGGNISQVNAAYSSYLRQYHQARFEIACAPIAYEPGSVVQDQGLALTGSCAELAAPLASDVAQWIREDRPGP